MDDFISREAVINAYLSADPEELFTVIIESIPSVDAVPVVHGEWLGGEYDGYADGYPAYDTYVCSACGAEFCSDAATYNFCPECGAKMDGENDATD